MSGQPMASALVKAPTGTNICKFLLESLIAHLKTLCVCVQDFSKNQVFHFQGLQSGCALWEHFRALH